MAEAPGQKGKGSHETVLYRLEENWFLKPRPVVSVTVDSTSMEAQYLIVKE